MPARLPRAVLGVLCLFFGTAAWAQQPDRGDLERRLVELEKQLTSLLKEVKDIRKDMQTASSAATGAPRAEIKVFSLRNADAVEMTRILSEIFGHDARAMALTADPRTNSLIVRSRADMLELIEAVVARLEEGKPREKGAEPVKKSARPSGLRRAQLERHVTVAESELAALKDRVTWSERMVKLGYLSDSQYRAETAKLRANENDVVRLKEELLTLPSEPVKKENPKK